METIIKAIDSENNIMEVNANISNSEKINGIESSQANSDDVDDVDDFDDFDDVDDFDDIDLYDWGGDDKFRDNELPNMADTNWFQTIGLYPLNLSEMEYFVEQLDVMHLFKEMCIDDIPKFSGKKLDIMYLLLKCENVEAVFFCEYVIRNFFEKSFNKVFHENIMPKISYPEKRSVDVFLDEFYVDISTLMLRFLTIYRKYIFRMDKIMEEPSQPNSSEVADQKEITPYEENPDEAIAYIKKRIVRYCYNLLNSSYYEKILRKFKIEMDDDFFKNNKYVFHKIALSVIKYTISVKCEYDNLKMFITEFIKNEKSDDELLNLIVSNYNITELNNAPSDAIDHFTDLMSYNMSQKEISKEKILRMWQYDNFLYTYQHKHLSKKYAFWRYEETFNWREYYENKKKKATNKANEIGMVLYPDNSMGDILEPFIKHCLVDCSKTLIGLLVDIMESSRSEPGIFSKYDDIDLETSFMLVSLSNDINTTYDSFLNDLKCKQKLIGVYPIEFVLRLISRLLNVQILFYRESMECTNIDNSLYKIYPVPIIIYQLDDMKYYLMHGVQDKFEPLGNYNKTPSDHTLFLNGRVGQESISRPTKCQLDIYEV